MKDVKEVNNEKMIIEDDYIFLNFKSRLNDEQLNAVTTTEGYVRVLAGAGTGKTRALTYRYAYLVKEIGISPKNILCCTFTNKAAAEMKKRVREMIGEYDFAYISTFHSFCVSFLQEEYKALKWPKNFRIIDTEDQKAILRICFEQLKVNSRTVTIDEMIDYIDVKKVDGAYCRLLDQGNSSELIKIKESDMEIRDKIYYYYLYEQLKSFAFDFDDMIFVVIYILENHEDILKKWSKNITYIMVDEFQDVDGSQYHLASLLSSYHKNLFIVGDPDQTIYTWRGSNVKFILDFDKIFPSCKTIVVDKNYRSSTSVINVANSLINNNEYRIDKSLSPIRNFNGFVRYYHASSMVEEASYVAIEIKKLIEEGNSYNDILILYRSHFVSRHFEEALLKNKIPYLIYSGVPFYSRKEIKDVLSYLRLLVDNDDLSLARVINEPKRNIGKITMENLRELAKGNNLYESLPLLKKKETTEFYEYIENLKKIYKEFKLTDLIDKIMNETGYEAMLRNQGDYDRLDNLAELKQAIDEFDKTAGEEVSLATYLNQIALLTNMDMVNTKEKIKMMTVHSAKGLEYKYVFLVGLSENIFPSKRCSTKLELEEERRLCFVAFTRAKDLLYLTDCEGINHDGSFRYPSRFIFDAGDENIEYVKELREELKHYSKTYRKKENFLATYKTLKVGDDVRHLRWGSGKILAVNNQEQSYEIEFKNFITTRVITFDVAKEVIKIIDGGE